MQLRPYQQECIDIIENKPPGSYLVQMATGLGKTATFSQIPRHGRVLLLSHREELVHQPAKYYDCPVGFERAEEHSDGEEVVSASVQTLVRRLGRFRPDDFDMIVVDEAHHSAAASYRKVLGYFRPRMTLGFTATPNRADNVGLDSVYSDIIFQRDLRWGILNGYLSDIECRRAEIGYDLSRVHTRLGDYAPGELADAMDGTADAIAEAYRRLARGATLIFAVNVEQCMEIANRIPGAVAVTGNTKDRADIVQAFTDGKIPCIVNCMVFTEGTDIPRVETVIIARPTQSDSLYSQMSGRGLRLYPGKDKLLLVDCVGVTGRASLCTAPSLLGIDVSGIPERRKNELQGLLFDLPVKAAAAADSPESWIRNIEFVDLWAKEMSYNMHNINFFRMPDGSLTVSLDRRRKIVIPCPDALGRVDGVPMQQVIDEVYVELQEKYAEQRPIWDLTILNRWGSAPATDKQKAIIKRKCRGFDMTGLTKGQASQILNRVLK